MIKDTIIMKEKINITENVAESVAGSLQDLLSRLKSERSELDKRISQIEMDLAALGHKANSGKKTQRRKWGLNKKEIQEFFESNPIKEFTSDKIAAQLNIPRSSTLSTLKRLEKDGFVASTEEGLWHKK